MPPHTSRAHYGPGLLFRLARKELTEILRDRRTIVTLIVMPLLLYPPLVIGLGLFVLGGKGADVAPTYRLGFPSQAEEDAMSAHLRGGLRGLASRTTASHQQPQLQSGVFDDLDGAVRQGHVDLGCRERRPAAPDRAAGDWDVLYREDSVTAQEALRYVEQLSAAGETELLRGRLQGFGVQPRPPVRLVAAPLPAEGRGGLSWAVFVPLVLILMTITGAVYPAIDLTAGERERGTLEVLIAAPVPRVSLLLAKYIAVVTVAVLTALVNLGSMSVSLLVSGFPAGIRPLTLLEIFGLLLLFAAFFSAVLLVFTSFARSFKEAQAYLIPLMVVALVPGVLGLLPGLSLSGPLAVVPLLNIVLLSRDLLGGHADPLSAAVVVISTAVYAVLAVALAAQVFGAEGVLYGESGGWRALFRRGKQE